MLLLLTGYGPGRIVHWVSLGQFLKNLLSRNFKLQMGCG